MMLGEPKSEKIQGYSVSEEAYFGSQLIKLFKNLSWFPFAPQANIRVKSQNEADLQFLWRLQL